MRKGSLSAEWHDCLINTFVFMKTLRSYILLANLIKPDRHFSSVHGFRDGFRALLGPNVIKLFMAVMEEHALKDVNNCFNDNIYSYLQT